jgi:hypothetical protein
MQYLFVNNIRGFYLTYIPILDVNFFVGENSTGKTSILSLIKILSSRNFRINPSFSTDDINFNHFNDIVSADSDKKYFDIGFIEISNKRNCEGENNVKAYLMTFTEKEGMPFLSVFTYIQDNELVRIRADKTIIKWKSSVLSNIPADETFIKDIYAKWIIEHRNDVKGYNKFPLEMTPEEFPLSITPFFIEVFLSQQNDKKYKPKNEISPLIFNNEIIWLAPIRTKPKRTYDTYKIDYSPEGDHTPYLIRKIIDKEPQAKKFIKYIEKIGVSSGLFEGISVKNYGKGATSPFELDIILNNRELNICNVGYGVSQSLPVIVELFFRDKNTWFAIQQPEVHLHPKAQAALGDIFFHLAIEENKKFLIETHSDYTIDRFRMNYRNKDKSKIPTSQILFFERNQKGNSVYQIKIDENGELPLDQPEKYREFFLKEEMNILGL